MKKILRALRRVFHCRQPRSTLDVRFFPTSTEPQKEKVGVAISGGGSRSLCAGMGELRALRDIGVLDAESIGMISACSGGNLAATIYTYRSPTVDECTLLGTSVPPGDLVWKSTTRSPANLSYINPKCLGFAPTRMFIPELALTALELKMRYNYPWSRMWMHVLGRKVFARYGLDPRDKHGFPDRYIGYTSEWARQNVAGIRADEFQLIPEGTNRPSLLTMASIFTDFGEVDYDLYPYEINAVRTGVRSTLKTGDRIVGGGFCNAYGLDSKSPKRIDSDQARVKAIKTSLVDAAGLSSAFYATLIAGGVFQLLEQLDRKHQATATYPEHHELWGWLERERERLRDELLHMVEADVLRTAHLGTPGTLIEALIPRYHYWPVADIATGTMSKEYHFADGGNLEDTSVAALIANGFTKVISFVNSNEGLREEQGELVVDHDLAALFGFTPWVEIDGVTGYHRFEDLSENQFKQLPKLAKPKYRNQIFATEDFKVLREKLRASSAPAGKPGVGAPWARQQLRLIDNKKFHITGGSNVTVIWFHLSLATSWTDALAEDVHAKLREDFPNYATLSPGFHAQDVNLLGNFSAWMVEQARDEIQDLCLLD